MCTRGVCWAPSCADLASFPLNLRRGIISWCSDGLVRLGAERRTQAGAGREENFYVA